MPVLAFLFNSIVDKCMILTQVPTLLPLVAIALANGSRRNPRRTFGVPPQVLGQLENPALCGSLTLKVYHNAVAPLGHCLVRAHVRVRNGGATIRLHMDQSIT